MPAKRERRGGGGGGGQQQESVNIRQPAARSNSEGGMYRRCNSSSSSNTQPAAGSWDHRQACTGEQKGICSELEIEASLVLLCGYILFFEICILYFNFFHVLFVLLLHRTQGARGAAGKGRKEGERGKGKGEGGEEDDRGEWKNKNGTVGE